MKSHAVTVAAIRLVLGARLAGALLACSLVVSNAGRHPIRAQAPDRPLTDNSRIPLEKLRLKDDSVFRGLIESESARATVFIEVFRPPGKPTSLLIRPIDAAQIAAVDRLPKPQREAAEKLVEESRNRVWIEAGRMESVDLKPVRENGRVALRYTGDWFDISSTADDESTRRAVVRLEQVFMAYRRVLPPRLKPTSRLSILLFGSMDEYREHLRQAGLEKLANPAYYAVKSNRIVSGADLVLYGEQLAKSRSENDAVRRLYDQAASKLNEHLAQLNRDLAAQGIGEDQRLQETRAWRARFQNELSEARRQIRAVERSNSSKFNRFAAQLLGQLYHEAFHAYVENFVYRHSEEQHLPRWLNEGLAQVFESGQFEADTLRLDAPPPETLAKLQEALRGGKGINLAQVLAADETPFVAIHEHQARASAQHYLYSWGLAYYLVFGPTKLDPTKVEQLAGDNRSSQERLERLVGMPLARFERQWREAMLGLSPHGIPRAFGK